MPAIEVGACRDAPTRQLRIIGRKIQGAFVTRFVFGIARRLAQVAIGLPILAILAACSGAVGGPAPVVDPTRITILPATATLYSGVPTTFVITGGTGSYLVASSNQAVIPVAGGISGGTLTVVPNAVTADTDVTLTVRDTGTTPTASASVTVKPSTVTNDVTVTPTLACAPGLCSGGDAQVVANLKQSGAALSGRSVRFDVISGDFRFITATSSTGTETLDTSATVVTDQLGVAQTRIRALSSAATQTALLQVTDLVSGAFQRRSFVIVAAAVPTLTVMPSAVTFQGRRVGECAGTDISATFYIFGGTPPYAVSNTISTLIVRPTTVLSSGGSFVVTPTGGCIAAPGAPIVVSDSAGKTTTSSVANIPGTEAIPALAVSPTTVNISSCDASASVQVAGGRSGTYFIASGSDALIATISGSTVTIQRRNPSGPAAATGSVGISDGTSVVTVQVTLSGAALGACPSPVFSASPTSVTLTDCSTSAQVLVSGGSGTYTATSDSGGVQASVSGNVVSIKRVNPSTAFTSGNVAISDGVSVIRIAVTGSGAGAGACGGGGGSDLAANPSTVTLTDCTNGALVTLSGGTGGYSATSSSSSVAAAVSGNVLSIRRVSPSAAFGGGSVSVSSGTSTITVAVNATGAGAGVCPTPTPITVSPSTLTLSDCINPAQASISGGTGSYTAVSGSGSVTATISGSVLSVRRTTQSPAFSGSTVTVSDGNSTATVTVNATGQGAGACPPPGSTFDASPRSVTISDCSSSPNVVLSGGSGNYIAGSSSTSITTTINGNILTISRRIPSPAISGSQTVTASDGSSSIPITVNVVGAGAGACT